MTSDLANVGPFIRPRMRAIDTERLVLREFEADDVKDLIGWRRDLGTAYTEAEALDFLDFALREYVKWGIGPWAMVLRETAVVIGSCGFCDIDLERTIGDVNYFVTPQFRGQGFATDALRAILEFGFADAGMTRIQARCIAGNAGSERVAQKAGMIFEREIASEQNSTEENSKEASAGFRLYAITRASFLEHTVDGGQQRVGTFP